MAELITWCRLMRVGPACAKPCDDCRITSGIIARSGVRFDPERFYDDPPRSDTMPDTTPHAHPFDPALPQRLRAFAAKATQYFQGAGLDPEHVYILETPDEERVTLADFQQLLERDAYAEKIRAKLAEKCRDYRTQLEDARSKRAGEKSPTEPHELGQWLRALPDRTILRSEAGNAWQLDHGIESGAGAPRKFRALVPALGEMPFEITDGHPDLEPLVEIGPFTILAISTPGSEDD